MVQLLPLGDGEKIATVLALPPDTSLWDSLHIVFATSKGNVRRNALSDFTNVMSKGKIAMKLEEDGERLVAVQPCSDRQDIVLATRGGKCIRFAVDDVRVFAGRNSTGVRGVKLAGDDEVISMALLRHTDRRFLLFCDDLSFDKDDAHYKSLKAVLDGCTHAGVWEDDSNIVDLRIYWADTVGGMLKVKVSEV
jgi:DNA gyrase/topoisomerase IV subunit A